MKMSEMRKTLSDSMNKVLSGELDQKDARGVIGMANQMIKSIQVELAYQKAQQALSRKAPLLGDTKLF